jgi:hypothetical protein
MAASKSLNMPVPGSGKADCNARAMRVERSWRPAGLRTGGFSRFWPPPRAIYRKPFPRSRMPRAVASIFSSSSASSTDMQGSAASRSQLLRSAALISTRLC